MARLRGFDNGQGITLAAAAPPETAAEAQAVRASLDQFLPHGTKRRASHVWPANWFLCWAFRLIRALVSDDHPVAAWTRTWPVRWKIVWQEPELAALAKRCKLDGMLFADRIAAIRAEVGLILAHLGRNGADVSGHA